VKLQPIILVISQKLNKADDMRVNFVSTKTVELELVCPLTQPSKGLEKFQIMNNLF
jgi:hypothetical protein